MKNVLYILTIALLMSACTYKNEPIALKPYEANYNGAISKEKKALYIDKVTDMRADRKHIGYALKESKKNIIFFSHENFAKKYKDALLYALNIAEFNTNVNRSEAALVVDVNIKEIELIKSDVSFDENLQGRILVELVVKHDNMITKHNFTQKAGKWMASSNSSKDLEPFLQELFADSVNAVVSKLAQK